MKVNTNSAWAKSPGWLRRVSGFFAYQLAAFASLLSPEAADKAMYEVLKTQFVEED